MILRHEGDHGVKSVDVHRWLQRFSGALIEPYCEGAKGCACRRNKVSLDLELETNAWVASRTAARNALQKLGVYVTPQSRSPGIVVKYRDVKLRNASTNHFRETKAVQGTFG